MKSREQRKRPSESFITGTVALVFLIVGYQGAIFMHRASVLKIEANRDRPDTVYVYETSVPQKPVPVLQNAPEAPPQQTVRKNAHHTPVVASVRKNLPVRKVESFPFNPNTVSQEDLCRLGFSPKQAASIVNYRNKGGRFRRKSDFARSYVVADSVYKRLEPFIDIPLTDLNLADSAALDALPGIGGWYATKILQHRAALGGYSYKEQLLDVGRMDSERYEALSDLIVVSDRYVTPYPLWSLPADSLRLHPYIGNYETARAIVLYRQTVPRQQWTVQGLQAAGILDMQSADRLSRCIIASP